MGSLWPGLIGEKATEFSCNAFTGYYMNAEVDLDHITAKALKLLREIKSITFATLKNGLPAARIIDVKLVKEDGLYFLTAGGKSF